MAPQTLFEKFGHKCEIHSTKQVLDARRKRGFRLGERLQNLRMINETNKRGYNYLRSQKKMESEYRKQLQYRMIIHPFSDFKLYWECVCMIFMLMQFYMIPLDVATTISQFPDNFNRSRTFITLRLIVDGISAFDVLVNFFCGYLNKKNGTVVLNPLKIASHYLMTTFVLDAACSIPVDVILTLNEIKLRLYMSRKAIFMVRWFSFVKLLRIYNFVKISTNFVENIGLSHVVYRVALVFVLFITILHLMCCLSIIWSSWSVPWYTELRDSLQFLKSFGPDITTFSSAYIRFFYCSSLILLNSGFGFSTDTTTARLFISFSWIICRLFYVIIIAYFMELHLAMQSSTQKFIDMVSEVKDYMRHRQIPDFLQKRILAYYDIKYQNCYFQESEILNTVSGQLRQEIVMNTCRKLVENVAFFKNLPLSLLVRIVSCLKYEIYLTNDIITKYGTTGDCMYFISNGTVAVYTKTGKEVCHLQDGDHFGEIALLMRESVRVASVIAAEICELYRLDRKDFIKAILPYPDLLEKILYVASERLEKTDILDEANRQGKEQSEAKGDK